MTAISLVCPNCRNQETYENNDLDMSKEITCSACGFSELPTAFELPNRRESKNRLILKIVIIILAGIVFVSIGLSLIVMLVWAAPFLAAALIVAKMYQRTKNKNAIRRT